MSLVLREDLASAHLARFQIMRRILAAIARRPEIEFMPLNQRVAEVQLAFCEAGDTEAYWWCGRLSHCYTKAKHKEDVQRIRISWEASRMAAATEDEVEARKEWREDREFSRARRY